MVNDQSIDIDLANESVRERASGRLPRLLVEVPLEGLPRVELVCATYEDELALRRWLRDSDPTRRTVPTAIDEILGRTA